MSEQAQETFSSDLSGMQEAARTLHDEREAAAAAEPARPAPREQSEDEAAQAQEGRDALRRLTFGHVDELLEKEGKKFNPRTGAETLAALRAYERSEADSIAADEAAALPAQQANGQAAEAPAVSAVPEIVAAKQQLADREQALAGAAAQYETGAKILLNAFYQNAVQEFGDIKTQEDIAKLAAADPGRYGRFRQAVDSIAEFRSHVEMVEQQGVQARRQQFDDFAKEQDAAFHSKHTELNDPAKLRETSQRILDTVKTYGFAEDEFLKAFHGERLIRDARVQSMLIDLAKYHGAQRAARTAMVRTVPQVQRPGPAREQRDTTEYERMSERLGGDLNLKQAHQLLMAKRSARR